MVQAPAILSRRNTKRPGITYGSSPALWMKSRSKSITSVSERGERGVGGEAGLHTDGGIPHRRHLSRVIPLLLHWIETSVAAMLQTSRCAFKLLPLRASIFSLLCCFTVTMTVSV